MDVHLFGFFYMRDINSSKLVLGSKKHQNCTETHSAGGMDWQAKRLEGKVFTVRFIDSAGQIHLEETGIALIPGVDEYEVLR